jgi:dimethylhistidine N-methyltransferase
VALDISRSALEITCRSLQGAHPGCRVVGVCCDYAAAAHLPEGLPSGQRRRLGFYPGSSIGNFTPTEAVGLLRQFRRLLGRAGLLLIGIDQPKAVERLEAAYNDAAGMSVAFARNLLVRLNRELMGDFDVEAFTYRVRWEPEHSRIALSLVSDRQQSVQLAGERWAFAAGEELITEYSVKYSAASFLDLAEAAGWQPLGRWTDRRNDLSLHLLGPMDTV